MFLFVSTADARAYRNNFVTYASQSKTNNHGSFYSSEISLTEIHVQNSYINFSQKRLKYLCMTLNEYCPAKPLYLSLSAPCLDSLIVRNTTLSSSRKDYLIIFISILLVSLMQ